MGSVYMAICKYRKVPPVEKNHPDKENPLTKKKPSVEKGTLLVKFGTSDSDNPKRRIDRVTNKFGLKHKCYAYYVSKYYKSIEEYMHARLEEERIPDLWSRLDDDDRKSYCSREHYIIFKKEALAHFQKAIETIEEFPIEWIKVDI